MGIVKHTFSVLLLFSLINTNPREHVTYEEKPELTWDDFRGTPPMNAIYKASVNSGIAYSFKSFYENGIFRYTTTVESQFYPELSWKKNLQESSATLLDHEQRHWDISHLYAQKLRLAFNNYKVKKPKKLRSELQFIFNQVEKERQAMQKRYDRETRHGTKREEQLRWEIFLAGELMKM